MSSNAISRRSVILGAAGLASTRSAFSQQNTRPGRGSGQFETHRFIEDVRQAHAGGDAQKAVESVLERAVSHPAGVLSALGEQPAGIHPIFRSDNITILNVVWAPLMVLFPHNHNMWASIGIYSGREDNILWERRGNVVAAQSAASLSTKEVFGLPADAIHSVTNPIGRRTGAIHIYGGDFFAPGRSEWDPESLHERAWDIDAARTEFTKAAERFEAVR